MLNMIYSLLLIQFREKVTRDSFSNFQTLLEKVREVEMFTKVQGCNEKVNFKDNKDEKSILKCTFCRKNINKQKIALKS